MTHSHPPAAHPDVPGLVFQDGPGPERAAPHRPEGHCPRGGPAVETRWPDQVTDLVVVRIGVQHDDPGQAVHATSAALGVLSGPHAPDKVERTRVRERGPADEVLVCYWTDPVEHAAWARSAPVRAWLDGLPLDGPLGHWVETHTAPTRRTETMYSRPHAAGTTTLAPVGWTELHDYPAAARDRIPEPGDLGTGGQVGLDLEPGASPRGRLVRTTGSPEGLCWIRTAQHLGDPPTDPGQRDLHREQSELYRDQVEPTYEAAVRYLGTEHEGCLSAHLLDAVRPDGSAAPGSEAVLWWRTLDDLLRWAADHPTHHAILGSFWTALIAPFGPEKLQLVLWHEVHVLPENGLDALYVNCRPGTGLLPRTAP